MRANEIKATLQNGEVLVGTFVMQFAVPSIATILASAGADYIIIDMEHTAFTMETVGSIVRASRGSDLPASSECRQSSDTLSQERLMWVPPG